MNPEEKGFSVRGERGEGGAEKDLIALAEANQPGM